jgi:hypothetical protein
MTTEERGPARMTGASTTHDELREKVARALWATRNPPYLFEAVSGDELIDLMAEADAALAAVREALREPSGVIEEIAAERRRQVEVEGWTPEHDDTHRFGEMAAAAASYAWFSTFSSDARAEMEFGPKRGFINLLWWMWPRSWSDRWWKPKDRRRDLIRAAALIVAEIERLDRAASPLADPRA